MVSSRISSQTCRKVQPTVIGQGSGFLPSRAADGRELALEEADNTLERDLLGRPVEPVTAASGRVRIERFRRMRKVGISCSKNQSRRRGATSKLLELHRPAVGKRQCQDGAGRVVRPTRDPHLISSREKTSDLLTNRETILCFPSTHFGDNLYIDCKRKINSPRLGH